MQQKISGTLHSTYTKAASKQEGPKNLGHLTKKKFFFSLKGLLLSGTPNFFGPSCFEAALTDNVCYICVEGVQN